MSVPDQKKQQRLDGKPPARPRGQQAVPRAKGEPVRPVAAPLPLMLRLGYRVGEYALTGTSVPHVWRGIGNGKIKTVDVNGVRSSRV
jgi:hypothetical protein